ncbi:MAG: hypothetical protein DMF61_24985 [Blastocatellia bacterium AA13]|nr:MAG: hypothetical protein DMF61_24985 [Blastocatellia bacterium AA13]
MTRKRFYLMLAIVGFVIPYYFFVSFLLANGPDGRLFLHQLFGTPISTFLRSICSSHVSYSSAT